MVAALAIALPIILAVMGVIVALKPPPPVGRIHWFWVGGFVLVGAIAIAIGIRDRRNADAEQQKMETIINGLKDSIDKMTKPIIAPTISQHDPDGLYQNGNMVGKVVAPRITLNESKVYFDQIENAGNLDTKKTFEYRDYILKFLRADSFIGMLVQVPGGVATNVYQRVVCEIVGRAH